MDWRPARRRQLHGDQQLKPGSSYILTMRDQPGECYVLLLLFSLRVQKMQYHNLFCVLRKVLLPPLHTQLACICSLLMRRVNATSQHHMWLEGLALRPYYDLYLSQLTTEAKPASIAGREEEVVSFWAKPYRQKLQALPAPNEFSTVWSAFQTPQGNLGDEVEFDKHGPLLNIYRPQSAKVWPNGRWPLYDSFHADLPCAEFPAVIVVKELAYTKAAAAAV